MMQSINSFATKESLYPMDGTFESNDRQYSKTFRNLIYFQHRDLTFYHEHIQPRAQVILI